MKQPNPDELRALANECPDSPLKSGVHGWASVTGNELVVRIEVCRDCGMLRIAPDKPSDYIHSALWLYFKPAFRVYGS